MPASRPIADRLADLTRKDPDGCWRFIGETRWGYGYIHEAGTGRSLRAHRVAYALEYGPIPDGLVVMHSCDVRSCVNPAHLSLGTYADNNLDMRRKNRHSPPPPGGGRAGATECVRGHRFTFYESGRHRCLTCEAEQKRERRRRAEHESSLRAPVMFHVDEKTKAPNAEVAA
jgi:hypothetical protein